jgi:hypothetical protein
MGFNMMCIERRVWRYQKGNQNPYIEEEQTAQWQKEKVQNDKQRSTNHTYKTNWCIMNMSRLTLFFFVFSQSI